jgi:hypothetical protein
MNITVIEKAVPAVPYDGLKVGDSFRASSAIFIKLYAAAGKEDWNITYDVMADPGVHDGQTVEPVSQLDITVHF